jgi:hypothetical protein
MKTRQKRVALIAGGLLTIGVATALVMNALNSNIAFFVTPTEVLEGKAPQDKAFRIGGLVKEGSIRRDNLTVHFLITDTAREVPVTYTGILPDLFKEGKARWPRAASKPRRQLRGNRGAGQARRKLHAGRSAARHRRGAKDRAEVQIDPISKISNQTAALTITKGDSQ